MHRMEKNMRSTISKATILIIDDDALNAKIIADMLNDFGAKTVVLLNGISVVERVKRILPDLILLDITMPEINGYEVCKIIKTELDLQAIPIIFISSLSEEFDKIRAFQVGGIDYITKPFYIEEVRMRVFTHLKIVKMNQEMSYTNQHLQQLVKKQVYKIIEEQKKVFAVQIAMVSALAKLSECRDKNTGEHLDRVKYYCQKISRVLATKTEFSEVIDEQFIDNIMHASILHDIGKVGIPDQILLKEGPLTPEEFEVMKLHTTLGAQTIADIVKKYPENKLTAMAMDIAQSHHENWDGSGYPLGMAGENIPLCARIMAIADVYDALRSVRPYKKPYSHKAACEIISGDRGKKFDSAIVDVFLEEEEAFAQIYNSYYRCST